MEAAVVLITVCFILWSALFYSRRDLRKYAANIPEEIGYPLLGNIQYLFIADMQRYSDVIRELSYRHRSDGIVKAWVGPTLVILVNHHKYVEAIANSQHAVKKGLLYRMVFGDYPNGVFVTDDLPKWRILRKAYNIQLTKTIINAEYQSVFLRGIKNFIQFLKKNRTEKEYNPVNDIYNIIFDIFTETHLGIKTNEVEESKIYFSHSCFAYLKAVVKYASTLFISKFISTFRRIVISLEEKPLKEIKEFLRWVLEERLKEEVNTQGERKYYSDFFIRRMKENKMPIEECMRELLDSIEAGVGTSPSFAINMLVYLALHPEIQEEAYKEQLMIVGENVEQDPTSEDLSAMVLLTRIQKEVLRCSCPELIFKEACNNIKLDDKYTIPKGASMVLHIGTIHTDKRYWERPMEFYPDHFLPDREAERPAYSYIPFGCGQRMCPGSHYGLVLNKVLMSFLLRNFKITTHMKIEDLKMVHKIMREFENALIVLRPR